MKKLLLLLSVVAFAACNNKNGVELTAKDAPENTAVYLLKIDNEAGSVTKIDSTTIKNGKAFLPYTFEDIEMTYLQIGKDDEGKNVNFFSDPGIIKVDFKYENPLESSISGTKNNEIFKELKTIISPIQEKMQLFMNEKVMELMVLSQSKNDEDQKKFNVLSKEYQSYLTEYNQIIESFIADHKNDHVGLDAFYKKVLSQEEEIEDYKKEFATFSTEMQNSKLGKKISQYFTNLEEITTKELKIGDQAPNFTIPTADGKTVELYDFIAKNKVTLIDFWASWCGPCRMENPNLVSAYKTFQNKGFEIIGVSLDSDKDKWLSAIEKDGLGWTQVSNLKGAKDPVTKDYAINGIPASFLVNAEGVIIALDLRGDELNAALEEQIK